MRQSKRKARQGVTDGGDARQAKPKDCVLQFIVTAIAQKDFSGSDSAGETPVPIPNTAVKPCSADGTASSRGWESRTPPGVM